MSTFIGFGLMWSVLKLLGVQTDNIEMVGLLIVLLILFEVIPLLRNQKSAEDGEE